MSDTGVRRINVGSNHYYRIDGRKSDGVTTLIGKGVPKPALAYWSARTVAEYVADANVDTLSALWDAGRDEMVRHLKGIPWAQRDAAAIRGIKVHELAEKISRDEEVDVPEHLVGHVDAAVKFMNEWKIRPVLMERPVFSRQWNYAGTFDLIADVPDGRRILFDYKTSASGIWPETALQLAAYRHAEAYLGTDDETEVPMGEIGIDQCMAVWLRADGYDVIPVRTNEEVFKTFLHVAFVARQMDVMKEWVLPAVGPFPEGWRYLGTTDDGAGTAFVGPIGATL